MNSNYQLFTAKCTSLPSSVVEIYLELNGQHNY